MRINYYVLLLASLMISCGKEKRSVESEPMKIADRFFITYKQDGPGEAVKRLFPTNKYISVADADTVSIKLEKLSKELDSYQGYELIGQKSYGSGVIYLAYLVKYSRQPLRFNFKFYNPGNGWRIQNFSYETDFLDELDETAKPYLLKENYDSE